MPTSVPVTSGDFYRDGGAAAIMRAAIYPDEVRSFLKLEMLTVLQVAMARGSDVLVELGCFDGRALEVARAAGIGYLGIDINVPAVHALLDRIRLEGLEGDADALVADATRSVLWRSAVRGRAPLELLPFNLLGNLPDPSVLFDGPLGRDWTGVLSVFNAEPHTTEVRRRYYSACGVDIVAVEDAPHGGVVFRGADGFASQSYSDDGLAHLLDELGLEIVHGRFHRYGACVAVGQRA